MICPIMHIAAKDMDLVCLRFGHTLYYRMTILSYQRMPSYERSEEIECMVLGLV